MSSSDQLAMRARLRAVIARQDAERGRPLTDREKLLNLGKALWPERSRCPHCAGRGCQDCDWFGVAQ